MTSHVLQAESAVADTRRYLRRPDAAAYLKNHHGIPCTVQTLAKLAVIGGGPLFQKFGKWPMYTPENLDSWVVGRMSKVVHSTSELNAEAV